MSDGTQTPTSPAQAAAWEQLAGRVDAAKLLKLAEQVDVNRLLDAVSTMDPATVAALAKPRREAAPRAHPPIRSDFYDYFDELSEEENAVRLRMRHFMETEVAPHVNEYWERAEFPFPLIDKFRDLNILETAYRGEGGLRTVHDGMLSLELARVDPGMATFYGVHAGLCGGSIYLCGSPEQREEWLPKLRSWEIIGAFGLTEPDVGSGVARGLTTRCRREGDSWVLNGQKKWIGNSTFGDIVIIWARDESDHQVRGFIVRTATDGYSVEKMWGKIAQRTVENGLITLKDVRVPEAERLQNANSFADTQRVLTMARCGTAWQAVGCAMGAYEKALQYAQERTQFGRPIGRFQLIQMMLVKMIGNVTAMLGLALRASRLQDRDGPKDENSALAKQFCAAKCREVVGLARELMGGNGILLEYGAARLFADAEAIYSYEGSNEINSLIVGRAVTGYSAFV